MLKLYLNEFKKLRRKKLLSIICFIAILMPILCTAICIRDSLPYRSLVGQLTYFGSFLIVPCFFSLILLMLFQAEEENDTLKNILVTSTAKWKIYVMKMLTSFTFVIAYNCITILYTTIGGSLFLNRFSFLYIGRTFLAYMATGAATIAASIPAVLVIILLRKRHLLSMILVNCMTIMNFLLVWQLGLPDNHILNLPILIAYRTTYRITIVEFSNFTEMMTEYMNQVSYPAWRGTGILLGTFILFGGVAMLVYQYQED